MVSLVEVSYSDSVCFELMCSPDYSATFGLTWLKVLLRVKPGLILMSSKKISWLEYQCPSGIFTCMI